MTNRQCADSRAIVAEDAEHVAYLHGDDTVSVFRKHPGGALVPMGQGRWKGGIVLESGVNCGILVRLEPELRLKSGTP